MTPNDCLLLTNAMILSRSSLVGGDLYNMRTKYNISIMWDDSQSHVILIHSTLPPTLVDELIAGCKKEKKKKDILATTNGGIVCVCVCV